MTNKTREAVMHILKTCKLLAGPKGADAKMVYLGHQGYDKLPEAIRWGLVDGYNGRPPTTSGLTSQEEPDPDIVKDYHEAYETGQKMSMCELPS